MFRVVVSVVAGDEYVLAPDVALVGGLHEVVRVRRRGFREGLD